MENTLSKTVALNFIAMCNEILGAPHDKSYFWLEYYGDDLKMCDVRYLSGNDKVSCEMSISTVWEMSNFLGRIIDGEFRNSIKL